MDTKPPHRASNSPISTRRTKSRTFRIYRDQIEYIEHINGDCASLFIRFLIDVWMNNKIPADIQKEFFRIRQELREKARLNELKQLILSHKEEDSEDAKI